MVVGKGDHVDTCIGQLLREFGSGAKPYALTRQARASPGNTGLQIQECHVGSSQRVANGRQEPFPSPLIADRPDTPIEHAVACHGQRKPGLPGDLGKQAHGLL